MGARLAREGFLEKETQKVGSYLRVWIWGGETPHRVVRISVVEEGSLLGWVVRVGVQQIGRECPNKSADIGEVELA